MKKAFTLAEVLITLGIIGVIAALTIPSLVAKHREKVLVNKLKKFYSTFSQAYLMAINEHGTFDTWELGDTTYTEDEDENSVADNDTLDRIDKFFKILSPYLKYDKKDKLENAEFNNYILADGTRITAMWLQTSQCSANKTKVCGDFYMAPDNKPYKKAKNWYNFSIYNNKIVPHGINDLEMTQCLNGTNLSYCTAWIIYNGNMDYLHCPEKLSWSGKHSCR